MDELTINPAFLRMLVIKVRAFMAKEGLVTPDTGGNPTDDEGPETLQDIPGDLSREEVIEEIDGLNQTQQAELVALMWVGRGDAEPEEWAELLKLAEERREVPASQYLLDHPLVADYWADALDKLGYGSMVEGVGEIRHEG
ncbi:MAG: DUF3775 domain-containing protein [Alphaproteobacteria bacterium]